MSSPSLEIINLRKQLSLFLIACIGVRVALAYIAKILPSAYLPIMGIPTIAMSIGFFYIYFTGSRDTGAEVFGKKIWWSDLRPIHGTLYMAFSLFAFAGNSMAWIFLALDVFLGLIAYLHHHAVNGDFKKAIMGQ